MVNLPFTGATKRPKGCFRRISIIYLLIRRRSRSALIYRRMSIEVLHQYWLYRRKEKSRKDYRSFSSLELNKNNKFLNFLSVKVQLRIAMIAQESIKLIEKDKRKKPYLPNHFSSQKRNQNLLKRIKMSLK